jgi:hypothetical protein
MDTLGAISALDMGKRKGVTALFYGQPGMGKTMLAAGAAMTPLGSAVLFLDTELGRTSLVGLPNVFVLGISQWQQFDTQFDKLVQRARDLPIKTIVIDTLSSAQRLGMDKLLKESKTPDLPSINDYGKSNEQILSMMRKFVDLADTRVDQKTGQVYLGWNVIFLCHVSEDRNEKIGITKIRPALTPKAAEAACGIPDIVGYLTQLKTGRRMLFMENYGDALGKIREPANISRMPSRMAIPNLEGTQGRLDLSVEPVLSYILRHWHGEIDLNDKEKYPTLFPKKTEGSIENNG